MAVGTARALVWMLVVVVAQFIPIGCNHGPFEIQLVNEGAYSITEVLVYPEPHRGETPSPEELVNRMPQDASGSTIALLPNDETMLPGLFPEDVYQISVTFYDSANQTFRQFQTPYPQNLTTVKSGYPVIVRAAMDADGAPDVGVEFIVPF